MECNKDESIRAREIAERKMQNGDFAGAKKFALKSQQLYPNLDNIPMLLAVCEVHCSAHDKKIGSEVDWYDVLQLEKMADEVTVKKQYRKLALLLHPDKNKFAGAEAAFKLIGEANRVLSNTATRSVFDLKVKAFMKTSTLKSKQPLNSSSGGFFVNQHQSTQPTVNKSANRHSMATGPQKKSQTSNQGSGKFLTVCPHCGTSVEYLKFFLGRRMSCNTCSGTFTAYETGHPVNKSNTNSSKPESLSSKGNSSSYHKGHEATRKAAQVKETPEQHSASSSRPAPSTKAGFPVSNKKPKFNNVDDVCQDAQKSCAKTEPRKLVLGLMANTFISKDKSKEKPEAVDSHQSSDGVIEAELKQDKSYSKSNNDVKEPCQHKRNISNIESLYNESTFAASSKMQDTGHINMNNQNRDGINNRVNDGVGINREVKEDDGNAFMTSMNRAEETARHYNNGISHEEEMLLHKKRKLQNGSTSNLVKEDVDEFEEKDSEITPDTSPDHHCPEPEFSDFDKGKEKHCFNVDQIWAVYDPVDAMPRYYARVRKVLATGFKLRITWLEPETRGENYTKSVDEGLPIGCGVFKHGASEVTTQPLIFSHRMVFELRTKGKQSSFVIYPRTSEIWALFRNSNVSWANDSETPKPYTFEFVIVLSDFDEKEGVKVAYLKKLEGFVSLFQRVTQDDGSLPCHIPPSNLFQFSHRIQYFQMSGSERDDVPEGSYELDTASLPSDIYKLDDLADGKSGHETKEDSSNSNNCCNNLKKPYGTSKRNDSSKKQSLDDPKQDLTDVRSTARSDQETGAAASTNPTTVIRRRSPRGLSIKPKRQ